jgi:hypothetical protein
MIDQVAKLLTTFFGEATARFTGAIGDPWYFEEVQAS